MEWSEKIGRGIYGMISGELGDSDAHQPRDSTHAPHVQPLRSQSKSGCEAGGPYCVDESAMLMPVLHTTEIHAALTDGKAISLMEKHRLREPSEFMRKLAERIRLRLDEMGAKQNDVAKAAGLSSQRFGNYVQGTRTPDIETLARLAKALGVSTDWLLGLSECGPVDIYPIVQSLLELEGLPSTRATVLASVVQEALRILIALPPEGDALLRSRLAAQAAWQSRLGSAPKQ